MQYQFTERYEYVKYIQFLNSNPLENVLNIRFFKEEEISGSFTLKEFRYSFDSSIWTNWDVLTQSKLSSIEFRNQPYFWLQVKYNRAGISSANIARWYLYYDSDTSTAPEPVDASIDADYLGGELPSYYLNRENHYGPYSTLLIENIVDGSTYGVYDSREDSTLGTTFYFKRVGSLGNDISINEVNGKILISLNKTYIDTSISNVYTYIDSSLTSRDSSISELFLMYGTYDSSILYLTNWNNVQDASITNLRQLVNNIDSSITIINSKLNNNETSLGNLSLWQVVQDSSISNLKSYIDGSLSVRDISLGNLSSWNVIQDSSLGNVSRWNVVQDSSIIGLRNVNNVQDVSIISLKNENIVQDASIVNLKTYIDGSLLTKDDSINSLIVWNRTQDVSLGNLSNKNGTQDVSLGNLSRWEVVQDSSISLLRTRTALIESSINFIQNEQVINIGLGDISIYSTRDSSKNILLKTIDQIGPVVITQDNSTILIDSSIVKIYDTTENASTYSPYTVGGITKGTSVGEIVRETYTQILDRILFPSLDPSIIEPYHTFTSNLSTVNTTGSNIYVNFYCTFNRGTITVNDIFQNYRAGLPYQYDFTGIDISGGFASSSLTYSFIDEPIDVPLGLSIWTAKVRYNGGPQPYDNKGVSYGTFLDSSITLESSVYTEGVWPLFATSSVISNLAQQTAVSMLYSDEVIIDLVPETGGYKQRFDIPDQWISSPTSRPLQGIKTYSQIGDVWNWEGGDASSSLTYWDVSTSTHDINSITVDYTSYEYNSVDRSSIKIKLIF